MDTGSKPIFPNTLLDPPDGRDEFDEEDKMTFQIKGLLCFSFKGFWSLSLFSFVIA